MTARVTAERHGHDVVDGDLPRVMGDFAVSVAERDMDTFHVCYSHASRALEVQISWWQFDSGAWKTLHVRKVAS